MLIPAPRIRSAQCPGGTAVLNLRSGEWQMFEGPGARIWNALVAYGSVAGLAEELAVPAGSDIVATRAAINAYVEGLRDKGLLVETAPSVRRWWMRWRR